MGSFFRWIFIGDTPPMQREFPIIGEFGFDQAMLFIHAHKIKGTFYNHNQSIQRENAMKQLKWAPALISIALSALFLDACSFSVQVITTPTAYSPTVLTTISSTSTAVPPTAIIPSATSALLSINLDTITMLEIFKSLELTESVRTMAFTPDGTVLAGAGGDEEDFTIHLWHAFSGEEIGALAGHTAIIWNVAFSPDGRMLASASSDGTVKIWDWHEGFLLKTLDFPDQVGTVNFSPDGRTLAVGGLDDSQNLTAAIWIFFTDSWKPLLKIPDYVNITAMAYTPNGRLLVGGGASRDVHVWRVSDGTSIFTLSHPHPSLDVAISPDNSVAATATCSFAVEDDCTEGGVWMWDLSTGKLIRHLEDFPDFVESVAFSADGSFLIAASRDGTVRVYAAPNFDLQFSADPPGGSGILALSPNDELLATASTNGEIRLWKVVERP